MSSVIDFTAIALSAVGAIVAVLALTKFNFRFVKEHVFTLLPIIVTATAAFLTTTTVYFQKPQIEIKQRIEERQLIEAHARLEELAKKHEELIKTLKQPVSVEKGVDTSVLRKVEARVASVESEVKNIEGIIVTDAERLVTVPILLKEVESLRKDISVLKEQQSMLSESLKDDVAEAKGQARWILGTLGIGLLALVVPLVRSSMGKSGNA